MHEPVPQADAHYQVIARKYRPRSFADLIGQEHVKTTLENALTQRRIAHGYIFSGQRGTGKTTVARIVARCLNCAEGPTVTPCGRCASCVEIHSGGSIDVIEIDAASNRGINEMRELRESVRFRPARDRYKVFIIDEAHQITSEAFNALLKTLEEPPEWVVFMLCTTEAHKIPNTIASRCQQFSFRSVDYEQVLGLLRDICARENIEAEAEALSVITLAGEGSVRDSLSALDQSIACCGRMLQAADVRQLLGRFSIQTLEQVAEALLALDGRRMLDIVQEMEGSGGNLQHFCRELCRFFRNLLVARIAGAESRLIAAGGPERERLGSLSSRFGEEDLTRYLQLTLELFQTMQYSLQPRMHLELGLLRMVQAGKLRPIEEILAELQSGAPRAAAAVTPKQPPARLTAPAAKQAAPGPQTASAAPTAGGDWRRRLLENLNEKGMTFIADAVEHSEIIERPGELEFVTGKEFSMAVRSSDMQKAVDSLARRPMKIKVTFTDKPAAAAPAADRGKNEDEGARKALENPEVQRYRELFPGSEVRAVRNLKE
ncbi:MAG: Holliday junction ATP-dependent DNA helicase RuvB [Bryobacteraceae bacterium]|nr:Holliday junction ATP-dependent DNA helicase RuvB [Bryobacteraceae bacterium]